MSFARQQIRLTPTRFGALSAVIACLALAGTQPAQANIGEKIIMRCTNGESLRGFSQSDYKKALEELEADTEEYSPCASEIRAAQLAAAAAGRGGAGGSSSGPGSSTPTTALLPTPAEQRAIKRARSAGSAPVQLGSGPVIHPGVVHVNVSSALSALPTPVLALLALLLAGLLVFAGGTLRNRVRGRTS